MAVVQHAASATVFSSGTSGTATATFGVSTTAGNCLIACVSASNASSNTAAVTAVKTGSLAENWVAGSAVTDTAISTYTAVWVDPNTGGGATAVNVTVTFNQTDSASAQTVTLLDIYEVSGIVISSPVDQTSTSTTGNSGTSWSSGLTGTTARASEIAFGVTIAVPTSGGTGTVNGPSSPWVLESTLSQAYTGAFGSYTAYQLSGYDALSATGVVNYNGTYNTASYWDACVLTLKNVITASAVATLSGSGTLSTAGVIAGAVSLSGTGTLTSTAYIAGSTALSGAGSLQAAGYFAPSAALSGSGTLSAVSLFSSAAFSGAGTLIAAATPLVPPVTPDAVPGLMQPGFLSPGVVLGTYALAQAVLSGSGTLTASGPPFGAASLSGSGTLTATSTAITLFTAHLSGAGTLTARTVLTRLSAAPLSGTGTLVVIGSRHITSYDAVPGHGSPALAVPAIPTSFTFPVQILLSDAASASDVLSVVVTAVLTDAAHAADSMVAGPPPPPHGLWEYIGYEVLVMMNATPVNGGSLVLIPGQAYNLNTQIPFQTRGHPYFNKTDYVET